MAILFGGRGWSTRSSCGHSVMPGRQPLRRKVNPAPEPYYIGLFISWVWVGRSPGTFRHDPTVQILQKVPDRFGRSPRGVISRPRSSGRASPTASRANIAGGARGRAVGERLGDAGVHAALCVAVGCYFFGSAAFGEGEAEAV